jgi:ribosomal protein S11
MKELAIRLDESFVSMLTEEVKQKRLQGAHTLSDRFLIRFLESMSNNSKVLLIKLQGNKLIVRNYDTLKYDDNRQAGTDYRKTNGENTQPVFPVQG